MVYTVLLCSHYAQRCGTESEDIQCNHFYCVQYNNTMPKFKEWVLDNFFRNTHTEAMEGNHTSQYTVAPIPYKGSGTQWAPLLLLVAKL